MQETIKVTLISSEHGFQDYDVQGLPKVHRACIGRNTNNGDIFNVYCDGGVKFGATWSSSLDKSLALFASSHVGYQALMAQATTGGIGKHDWAVGEECGDGFAVFVDDRPLGYRKSAELARQYALEIIARLQADGDYRLNDKPAGFLPPALHVIDAQSTVGLPSRMPNFVPDRQE